MFKHLHGLIFLLHWERYSVGVAAELGKVLIEDEGDEFLFGRSKERGLFFPAPIDYAMWMQKTEALFKRLSSRVRH